MSKKFCRDGKKLSKKINGRKQLYVCVKCDQLSPKEKWCCKPAKIEP